VSPKSRSRLPSPTSVPCRNGLNGEGRYGVISSDIGCHGLPTTRNGQTILDGAEAISIRGGWEEGLVSHWEHRAVSGSIEP